MARQERSAGFVIFRSAGKSAREYLLLDYGRHWDFAKGHVEKGEDDLTTALRELREETGIVGVRVVRGFQHEVTYFFKDRRKGLVRKRVVFFLGETATAPCDILLSHEHEGFAFLPFDVAVKRLTFPTARQILRLAEQAAVAQQTEPHGDTLSQKPSVS
jgi:8-oxo-dGTP pyrophosphatase MutT (NUDIX family)